MLRSLIVLLFLPIYCVGQDVYTEDIDRFWRAYDLISSTRDTAEQRQILQREYLDPASSGLVALRELRNYTADRYLQAIRDYPQFWQSIRPLTRDVDRYAGRIRRGVDRLRTLYPALRPAAVYFAVGALYTNGTTLDSLVLIGSELALADSTVRTAELPGRLGDNLRRFFDSNPREDLVLLNVHEFVHTQQDGPGYDLLSQCLYEGVAEFVSCLAMEQPSAVPALPFGKNNTERIRQRFAEQAFSPNYDLWLYNSYENEFQMRDLGYYVGYAIAEAYYERQADSLLAIARLLELDYQDARAVATLVDESGWLPRSVAALQQEYEAAQPRVLRIAPFDNGARDVDPSITEIRVTFDQPMDTLHRGFEFGPRGRDALLYVQEFLGWDNERTMRFRVALEPGRHYQLLLSGRFRNQRGVALREELVELWTGE